MVFSYRLDDAPIENRNFCPRDRCSFRGWRKREKTTRFSRGWQLQLSFMRRFFFLSFFFLSSGLLYDKSQRDEWATLDWSERSRPLRNSGSFAPLRGGQKSGGWRNCGDRVVEGGNVRREWIEEEREWYGESCYQTRRRSNEF